MPPFPRAKLRRVAEAVSKDAVPARLASIREQMKLLSDYL
jgi:hypothetical protein